jgi:hypothetical protein
MTIRAIGIKAGYQTSDIKAESYQIGSTSSTDSIWGGGSLAVANETFSVSFMVTPATNSLVGLASAKTENFADLAAIVRFAPDGFVDARNGGIYQASSSLPYTPGNTYKVLMSVDMANHRYSVTVTPAGATSVVIATNYAFRTEQADGGEFKLSGYLVATGSCNSQRSEHWNSAKSSYGTKSAGSGRSACAVDAK